LCAAKTNFEIYLDTLDGFLELKSPSFELVNYHVTVQAISMVPALDTIGFSGLSMFSILCPRRN